jgi:uncharacterized radical SAM superfamily Fe-S cluster-containing enzyme
MLTQQQVKKVLRSTKSICPECFKVIDANIFVDEKDVVKIGKNCPTHGYFEDTYTFSSLKLYLWAEKYAKE